MGLGSGPRLGLGLGMGLEVAILIIRIHFPSAGIRMGHSLFSVLHISLKEIVRTIAFENGQFQFAAPHTYYGW